MAYTLAYLNSPVPGIPDPGSLRLRPRDRHEHFGTEEAALRRASELLPPAGWLDLRLYGPDGRLLATQERLVSHLREAPRAPATPAESATRMSP